MKRLLMLAVWSSLVLPARADVLIHDLVTKLYGKRTRVELVYSNPGYADQPGPVVITLQGREAEDKPWQDLHEWKLNHLAPSSEQHLEVFHSDLLTRLSHSKTFQTQVRVQAPSLEPVEKLGRLEKPEE